MENRPMKSLAALGLALIAATGCSGGGNSNSATDQANVVSTDPYGATGAPGADMTDNGATDGANGLADGNIQ
jgi:hypothetical protein